MPEVFGEGTALRITELSGEGRTLSLAGRALPYRPIGFSGTMRAEFTWYPGNPTATVQVLGASEDTTSINGMWKTKFLTPIDGTAPAIATLAGVNIGNSMDLVLAVDDIRRKGQLLEFQWDVIIRWGILTKFTYKFNNRLDVTWEMTFTWINQGEPEVPAVLSNQINLASISGAWASLQVRLQGALEFPPNEETGGLTALNDTADKVLQNISAIGDTVTSTVSSATDAVDAAQRFSGVFDTTIDAAASVKADLDSQWESLQFVSPDTNPNLAFYQRLVNLTWKREVYETMSASESQAALQKSDALKQITPDVIKTFLGREGQDLRDISTQVYGTPNEWRTLADYNGLTSSELTAGQVILAPQLATAQS
jgi:hypothetical protein